MLVLTAQNRDKKPNALRRDGQIPAVAYGPTMESQNLTVVDLDFNKIFNQAGESDLINLKLPLAKNKKSDSQLSEIQVLIHEVQKHPLSGDIIHVDFYAPDLTKTVRVAIPLVFIGEAPAVKDLDGILVKNMQEVEVEALPKDLPHQIEVDVICLKNFEDKILISDLPLPQGVAVLADADEVISLVTPPRSEEELAALETALEEKVEDVEVAGKKVDEAETTEAEN